jgi:glutamine amidotransferase
VERALHHLGFGAKITNQKSDVLKSDVIVLPGQGAFEETMSNLNADGLSEIVKGHIRDEKPFLGICIGFQVLFESSEENGLTEGLGVFPGRFRMFDKQKLTVPLMGWNQLSIKRDPNHIFAGAGDAPYVYFANSFYVERTDPAIISTTTEYGGAFVSSIQAKNLFATQFHPEKSGELGLGLLKKFLESCR